MRVCQWKWCSLTTGDSHLLEGHLAVLAAFKAQKLYCNSMCNEKEQRRLPSLSTNDMREESSHLLDCTLSNWVWTSLTLGDTQKL